MKDGRMNIYLTKGEVCEIFASVIKQWKQPSDDIYPCFINETWYVECFHFYLSRMLVETYIDVVPLITEKFNNGLDTSFRNICKVLEQNPVDGTTIFEIMDKQKFIYMKDRKTYNRQVWGKWPKGLKREEWEEYNHWVLANLYWQGFLWSQESGFQITVPQDADGPIELFLADETKPLWGMRIKSLEAGTPIIGTDGDCIRVRPYVSIGSAFESHFIKNKQ